MVYQNPGSALNPSIRAGLRSPRRSRCSEPRRRGARARSGGARPRADRRSRSVLGRYPHQLSGGMQQRVVIAMALAKDPALLILDEPTTGLDATVEAEVLDLVAKLQAELHTSVLFISHNLGVISKMCSRVGVLYAGRLVEEGPVETVLRGSAAPVHGRPPPLHPTRWSPQGPRAARHHPGVPPEPRDRAPGLRVRGALRARGRALPRRGAAAPRNHRRPRSRCWYHERAHDLPREEAADVDLPAVDREGAPLVQLEGLTKVFRQRATTSTRSPTSSVQIWPGETLGLVGESGSGKTTLARTLLGIVAPTGAPHLQGRSFRPATRSARAPICGRSRSSSRTRTRRSTAATRCGGSSSAR